MILFRSDAPHRTHTICCISLLRRNSATFNMFKKNYMIKKKLFWYSKKMHPKFVKASWLRNWKIWLQFRKPNNSWVIDIILFLFVLISFWLILQEPLCLWMTSLWFIRQSSLGFLHNLFKNWSFRITHKTCISLFCRAVPQFRKK